MSHYCRSANRRLRAGLAVFSLAFPVAALAELPPPVFARTQLDGACPQGAFLSASGGASYEARYSCKQVYPGWTLGVGIPWFWGVTGCIATGQTSGYPGGYPYGPLEAWCDYGGSKVKSNCNGEACYTVTCVNPPACVTCQQPNAMATNITTCTCVPGYEELNGGCSTRDGTCRLH